jgi:hypothetical protein
MPKFKDDKEWFKEAKRLHQEQGLNASQIREKIGFHEGYRIDNSGSKGIRKINLATKLKKDTARNAKSKAPESTRQFFDSDESYQKYLDANAQDLRGIQSRTSKASKDSGTLYHKGHMQSSKEGGSWTSRNFRLENGSNNSSHGQTSPSRASLLTSGTPVDWDGDAINYLDPSGLPQEYTPKDKQRIQNAPADKVDEVTAQVDAERWKAIKENPDARPIRTNPNPQRRGPTTTQQFQGLTIDSHKPGTRLPRKGKLKIPKVNIPLAGGLLAGGAALLSGGSPAQALESLVEAENPIENLDAGPIFNEKMDFGEYLKIAKAQNAKPLWERLQSGAFGTQAIRGRSGAQRSQQ